MREQTYLARFLNLKSSGDILNIVNPINNAEKEISESWGILRKIKPLTLHDKMKYSVVDLCAGNALTSVMSVFVLPVKRAIAIDIKMRKRRWENAKRFQYAQGDIYNQQGEHKLFESESFQDIIIVSSHPCKHAIRVIDIFNQSYAKALCIIPCCNTEIKIMGQVFLSDKMNKYDVWTYYLASLITPEAKITIETDKRILSPKNNVIYAERK